MGDPLARLQEAAAGRAEEASDTDRADGVAARFVVRPADAEQTAAVLRACSDEGLAVVTRGAGSKLGWGRPPRRLDVLLDTTGMDALVEHAAGDLVAVVGAGRPLAQLQDDLSPAGQWLAVDPPRAGTVGGTVAAALSGPIRLAHGAVRDLLIGATFVLADGTIAHSGGKVVKNVAGYDVGKLLTGSLGTLAVLTQVAFRLHPVPPATSWVTAPVGGPEETHRLVQAVIHSQTMPSAVELDRTSATSGELAVQLDGVGPGVEQRAETMRAILGADGAVTNEPPTWWGAEPFGTGEVELRLTHELGALDRLLQAVAEAERTTGLTVHLRGSVGVGTVLAGVDEPSQTDGVAALVTALRDRAGTFGGTVVVRDAPAEVKSAVDVWGPVQALSLMRSVKERFDPESLLSPGRFVGGI